MRITVAHIVFGRYKKFDFDMSPDDKKEVSEMCNVSRGILDKGMALGRKEGMDDSTIAAIKKAKDGTVYEN